MVGGHRRLCCYFAHSVVLFLGLSLHDVQASTKRPVIKKVGDTVELSANLPTEGVTFAVWKYEGNKVADGEAGVLNNNPFGTRLEINQKNFSLTVKNLIPEDSGEFSFVSAINGKQRETVFITLQVREIITQQPVLTFTVGPPISNGSCTVLVNCSAAPGSSVTYSITLGNQSYGGPSLQHTIRPQDGDTTATCTVSNDVSEKSASKKVTCEKPEKAKLVWIMSAAGGCLLIFIIIGVTAFTCHCKHKSSASESDELTVYADISNVTTECANQQGNQEPCSFYDTIQDGGGSDIRRVPPQTVYDQIQLSRMRAPSVSPYQEIS